MNIKSDKLNIDNVFYILINNGSFDWYDLYPNYSIPFDEDEETMFQTKEKANQYANYVIDTFNSLPHQIPIYRTLFVNNENDIDYDYLGESWSFYKESAIQFGLHNNSNYLISAIIDEVYVNWDETLKRFTLFSFGGDIDDENEIVVDDTSKIKNVKIEKLHEKKINLKEFTKKIIREYLNEEIDKQKDLAKFLSDKKFINPKSKLYLYHGTKISPEKFNLRDDYDWEDSHGWSGDLPEGYLFLTTNLNEAKAYGQYVIPCELKRYDNKYFNVNANNPSRVFDMDYGIDLYMPDKYVGFWEKFEESGKSVLIIKGTDRWTVITNIDNIIPRVDLAVEFYNNQPLDENIPNNNFGNGSVMVKNNMPIIFFHGTNNIFNEFTTKRRGVFGLGYYFTTDKKEANGYGKNIMSVYLKINNPASPKNVQELTTLIPDYKYMDDTELATEITKQLIKNGFDGVVFNYPNGDLLTMVINPNQIKIIKNNEQLNQPLNENRNINKLFNNNGDTVKIDDNYAHAELNLETLEDGETSINISEIWSDIKGKGYATKLLNKLKRYSDKTGIPLSLRASTANNIKTSGGLNQDELVNWYIKNGFKISEENNRFPSDSTAPFMVYNY